MDVNESAGLVNEGAGQGFIFSLTRVTKRLIYMTTALLRVAKSSKGESNDEERNQEESTGQEKGSKEKVEDCGVIENEAAPRNRGRFYW